MRPLQMNRWDLVLPGLLGVVGTVEITAAGYDPLWLTLGTYLLATAVLSAGRFAPLAVPPLVTAIYATGLLLGVEVVEAASWVPLIGSACLVTGLCAPRRRWIAGLVCVLAATVIVYAGLEFLTDFDPYFLFALIMTVGPWTLGVGLREALTQNRRAGAAAERARVGRELAGRRAAACERERIAVELHDVLAHALGAMVVQASVAGDLTRSDPQAAAVALGDVARVGREALSETGRLLRLLRDDEDELGLQGSGAAAQTTHAGGRAGSIGRGDVLVPAIFGVIGTIEIASAGFEPLWTTLGVYWLALGVLCARRAFPLAMPIAVAAILVGARAAGVESGEAAASILVGGLAFFSAGRHVPRSRAGWGLASVLASVGLFVLDAWARGERPADVVLIVVAGLVPWLFGAALRETLERTRAFAAVAERERLQQELAAERATSAERRRIARELHDVLANSLSVMIVQATLAGELAGQDPVQATTAVSEVERSGRRGMGEIGRLLRLIENGGGNDQGTRPQQGVADLPALADEFVRAGLAVDLDLEGATRLPVGVDLSTYRIVQEGLTNALKHAPGSAVRVRLARRDSSLSIQVCNGPAAASSTGPLTPSGHGLVGVRERVSLFGGDLDARPTVEGGFVLAATIPIRAESP